MSKPSKKRPGKLGRNDPCFCGSGLKYKRCCLLKGLKPPRPISEIPQEVIDHFNQVEADRLFTETKGIYINFPNTISWQGKSFLAVANGIMWEDKENLTFHELILKNLQRTLGKEWWDAESTKKEADRHFIRRCFDDINTQPSGDRNTRYEGDGKYSHLPTGVEQTLLNLAFDVYLLTHKNFLPDDWLVRLRDRNEYQGVRYEITVASLFVRTGCDLEFYDERNTKTKHAEFKATHNETGNTVVVEAKSRQRPGVIHQPGTADYRKAMLGDVTRLFNRALQKDDEGLPFFIFIDVNSPIDSTQKTIETRWFADIKKMIEASGEVNEENLQPYTALFVTNYASHYDDTELTSSGQNIIQTSQYVKHPLKSGVMDIFLGKLQQATNGYGFVPHI